MNGLLQLLPILMVFAAAGLGWAGVSILARNADRRNDRAWSERARTHDITRSGVKWH